MSEDRFTGRIPPHDTEAEISVLGAMLLGKEAISSAVELLTGEMFYSDAHRKIFTAIGEVYNGNQPADVLTVADALKKKGELEDVGGYTALAEISSSVVSTSHITAYCQIVRDKYTLRRLIRAGDEIVGDSYTQQGEVAAIIEKAEKNIFEITQGAQRGGLRHIKEPMMASWSLLEERARNPKALTGLSTGFADLDRKLSGLQKSDLILLAARPSMGKTALMVNIATNVALKEQGTVAMFSLEMSAMQLVQRMISSNAHVDLQKIISGDRMGEEDWQRIIDAMPFITGMDIHIDDTAALTPLEMKAKCRRLKAEKALDLVVVDYLQLMETSGRRENRQQEISAISRALKGIAKELEVPVIALSQLSRAPEMRQDKRPILSDLRESGAIEQDADIVMFLYRDDYYNEDSEKPNTGEVIIAKHRNGPTGTVDLVFKKEFTKFVNREFEESR